MRCFKPPGSFLTPLPLPPSFPAGDCRRVSMTPEGERQAHARRSRPRPHAHQEPPRFLCCRFIRQSPRLRAAALFFIVWHFRHFARWEYQPSAIGRHESGRRGSARSSHQNAYFYRPQNPQNLDQTVYGILDQTVYENHAPQNTAEMAHRRQKRRIAPRKKHPSGYQTTENT